MFTRLERWFELRDKIRLWSTVRYIEHDDCEDSFFHEYGLLD